MVGDWDILELIGCAVLNSAAFKDFVSGRTVFWVAGEHKADQVFGVLRNPLPSGSSEAEFSTKDRLVYSFVVWAVERRGPGKHEVKYDPTAPNIALLIISAL